jgi:hypothetical protein
VALPPDLEQREVTEAAVFMGGSVKVITWINDLVYWIQQHLRAKMIVVPLDRLVPYLEAT